MNRRDLLRTIPLAAMALALPANALNPIPVRKTGSLEFYSIVHAHSVHSKACFLDWYYKNPNGEVDTYPKGMAPSWRVLVDTKIIPNNLWMSQFIEANWDPEFYYLGNTDKVYPAPIQEFMDYHEYWWNEHLEYLNGENPNYKWLSYSNFPIEFNRFINLKLLEEGKDLQNQKLKLRF